MSLSSDDTLRLNEAYRLIDAIGDEVWPGWASAPFGVLVVQDDAEYLVNYGDPPPEFEPTGERLAVGHDIWRRPRAFDPRLAAAFPAFGGPSVVVIGSPAALERSSTAWVLTVAHEHFHQFQYALPGYVSAVDGLGLAEEGDNGMWMLNHPFPYDDPRVAADFSRLAAALADAITGRGEPSDVWRALASFSDNLRAADAAYFRFQLWQEGVARAVEFRTAQAAIAAYTPSTEFTALPDATSFADAAAGLHEAMMSDLGRTDLSAAGRVAFYSVGAALAALLDREDPSWKERYEHCDFSLVPPA